VGQENAHQVPRQYGPPAQPYGYPDPLVANRVSAPAIALIVTAAVGLALQILSLPINLLQLAGGAAAPPPMDIPFVFDPRVAVASGVIGILIGIIVLIGALKMKNLESYGFAVASAIIAMVPCFSPCCFLGLPFGIWALVVLSDPQVKAAFRS
jgi:hypothetical protein